MNPKTLTSEQKSALDNFKTALMPAAAFRASYDEDEHSSNKFRDYGLYVDAVVEAWANTCALVDPGYHPLLLTKALKEINKHLFTCNYAHEAFHIVSSRMPMSLELYSAFIIKVSTIQDLQCVKRLLHDNAIAADDFRSLFKALAVKRSYGALSLLFHAWIRDKPANTMAEKEEVGDIAWKIILYSEMFTRCGLHPGLVQFIRVFEKCLKETLPLLSKNGEPLILLPDLEILDLLKEAGFNELSSLIAHSLLHIDDIYTKDKFAFLEQRGVLVTEDVIKERLSMAASENGWKMAISYYLHNDTLVLDESTIYRPSILNASNNQSEAFSIKAKQLLKVLDAGSSSEIADKKRLGLIALYVDGNPDIIKKLLKAGLPERYLEVASIREEKLMLDLGI